MSYWAIVNKLRVPDGLFLAYPALNLDLKQYTPSILLTLQDEIIPYTILKICINSYIQNQDWDAKSDPFLSPLNASEEVRYSV